MRTRDFTLPPTPDAAAGWNWHRCHPSHVSATHPVCAIACPQFRACYTYGSNGKNHCHRQVALFWIFTTGDDIIYVDTNHADCLHFWWGTKTSLPTGSAKIALVSICFYQSGPVFHSLIRKVLDGIPHFRCVYAPFPSRSASTTTPNPIPRTISLAVKEVLQQVAE